MVVSELVFTIDPQQLAAAYQALLDSERVLAAHGRCRRWCVVRSGRNEFISYAYYDDLAQAEAAVPHIYSCLRNAAGTFETVSTRELREVVFERTFDA